MVRGEARAIESQRLHLVAEQRTVLLAQAADAGDYRSKRGVEPDAHPGLANEGHVAGEGEGAAARGDDRRLGRLDRVEQRRVLELAEGGLPRALEDLPHRHARVRRDGAVEVDEEPAQRRGQRTADAALAAAHEAGEEDTRRAHAGASADSPAACSKRRQLAATSAGATAESTATESAPASSTEPRLPASMPPMATSGLAVSARASRTSSSPTTASGSALLRVGKTGPTASTSTAGSAAAAASWARSWVEAPIHTPGPSTRRAAAGGRSRCPRCTPPTGRSAARSTRSFTQSVAAVPSRRRQHSSTSRQTSAPEAPFARNWIQRTPASAMADTAAGRRPSPSAPRSARA